MPRCASLAAAHTIAAWLPSVGVLHLGDGWLTAQLCKNGSLQAALRDGDLVVKKVGPVCSQYPRCHWSPNSIAAVPLL